MGLNIGDNDGDRWKGLELTYHYKTEKWNAALSWNRQLFDDFDNKDKDLLWFTGYSNAAIYGGLGGLSENGNDFEFNLINLGKIWTLEMGVSVGFSYSASFASSAGVDKGLISLDLGYTF